VRRRERKLKRIIFTVLGLGLLFACGNPVEIQGILISQPSTSTEWIWNQTNTEIVWECCLGSSVMIELWKGVSKVADLSDWTDDDGSFTIFEAITESWGEGSNYRIKLVDDLENIGWSEEFCISSLPGGMEFVSIPQGSFAMGAPAGEEGSELDERPLHTVTFNYDFEIMTTEVTQSMWLQVMGGNPSHFTGDLNRPVEKVSWNDCQDFVDAMNSLDPSHTYRLPSESEWEYCCRAGTTTRFFWGEDTNETEIDSYAWWWYGSPTHPVAQKHSNSWGLYDMSGNVNEWCEDWYHGNYNDAPSDGSAWLDPSGSFRVYRGGSCWSKASECRSANRSSNVLGYRRRHLGLRLVRS